MHLNRIITAIIAIPLLYLYVTKLPPLFFLLILVVVGAIAQIEFYKMYQTRRIFSFLGVLCGILILGHPLFVYIEGGSYNFSNLHFAILVFSFMLISTARLFLFKEPSDSLKDISAALIGLLYIPNLLFMQWLLRLEGVEWILFLYAAVWMSDTLAYYIGRNFGKRRLYVTVSPNKTVEGALGSLIGGLFAGLLMGLLVLNNVNIYLLAAFGLIIGAVSIVGDLVESLFKRDADIKDSGSLIPGHGGFLDRIDSALFAGVVLYWLVLTL